MVELRRLRGHQRVKLPLVVLVVCDGIAGALQFEELEFLE